MLIKWSDRWRLLTRNGHRRGAVAVDGGDEQRKRDRFIALLRRKSGMIRNHGSARIRRHSFRVTSNQRRTHQHGHHETFHYFNHFLTIFE